MRAGLGGCMLWYTNLKQKAAAEAANFVIEAVYDTRKLTGHLVGPSCKAYADWKTVSIGDL